MLFIKENFRMLKVNELIKRTISKEILTFTELNNNIISISRVITSKDLSFSKVYFLLLNNDNKKYILKILNKLSSKIRMKVSKNIRLKICPRIKFFVDDLFDDERK